MHVSSNGYLLVCREMAGGRNDQATANALKAMTHVMEQVHHAL